jgi:hypothetical protein
MVGGAEHRAVGAAPEADDDFVGTKGDVAGGGEEAAPDGVGGGGLVARQATAQGVVRARFAAATAGYESGLSGTEAMR